MKALVGLAMLAALFWYERKHRDIPDFSGCNWFALHPNGGGV